MKDKLFYKIGKPLVMLFIKLYRPTIIGKENIPTNTNYILAGNHTSYLDPILVASSTKRQVHFFAKDSLYKGIKKVLFKGLGIIPVNRSIKDKWALSAGIDALNNNLIVGIFPEGTINKSENAILPFKYGAVKMSNETDTLIVPFAIIGKFKFLRKCVKIVFGLPFIAKDNLEKENKLLENKIIELLRS